jgi:hypothetical protein
VRRLPFVLLFPALLGAAELTADHVTVAGKDLKTMMAKLEAVGIHCEYGGRHNNRATEMAITSFPDGSYLELIAPQPDADAHALATHPWAAGMQKDAGPCAWAARSKDVAADVGPIRERGVPVGGIVKAGRDRPDGVHLEWETVQIGTEPNGTFFPFLISDITPRRDRAFPTGKPTVKDFSGVVKVVIAVRDLKASGERYRRAFDLERPIQQVDDGWQAHLAQFGGTPVVLAAPLTPDSWNAARIERFGEGPCAFVLGGRHTARYRAVSKTRWFGIDVSWLDAAQLGWHLGFEDAGE